METLTQNYRRIICEFLAELAHEDEGAVLVFDKERDRYLLLHNQWRKDESRVYGCAIHLDLIDDKIWVQHNSTEIALDQELCDRGVKPTDFVLGFRSPSARSHLAAMMSS
ncbi:MAG: XisI protein [Spirulinaceae cyanobacterium]